MPSLSNSPWMRGAPHSGFACAICQTRSRVRRSMGGRPGARRERQVQNRRKAERCPRTTVAGFYDHEGVAPAEPRARQGHPEEAVRPDERRASAATLKNGKLLAEGEILEGKRAARSERGPG